MNWKVIGRKLNTNNANVNDQIADQEQQAQDNADSVRQDLEKAEVAARVKARKARKSCVSPLRF